MHVVQIIPARRWRNVETGATASVFGAVPYVSDADAANWITEELGHTFMWSDGTVRGPGGRPLATLEEAEAAANKINAERRRQIEAHAQSWPDQAEHCAQRAAEIPTF